MKLFSTLVLAALASAATAQTTNFSPLGSNRQGIEKSPVASLTITSVTHAQAIDPGVMVMTGTGLDRVEQVFLGGVEARILSQNQGELLFQPREGDPGHWMVVAMTPFEQAEFMTELMPCLSVKPQDAYWGEGRTRYKLVDNLVGVHLESGYPGYYMIWVSPSQRVLPLVLDPPIAYEFWLGDTYRLLDAGVVPSSVDRLVLQYRLPADMIGQTMYFQAMVVQDMGSNQRKSFTNMEKLDF